MAKIPQIQKKVLTQNSNHFLIHVSKLLNPTQSVSNSDSLAQSEVGSRKLNTLASRGYFFSSWDDVVRPWAFGGTRMALDYSFILSQIKHFTPTPLT